MAETIKAGNIINAFCKGIGDSQKSELILSTYNSLKEKIPFPVVEFARSLGFQVKTEEFKMPSEAGYICFEEGIYKIAVNRSQSILRQRFTVAHELGHYFYFHITPTSLKKERRDYSNRLLYEDYNDKEEGEANSFAADLLMPFDSFIENYQISEGSISFLAKHFGVSESAITFRVANLVKSGELTDSIPWR